MDRVAESVVMLGLVAVRLQLADQELVRLARGSAQCREAAIRIQAEASEHLGHRHRQEPPE
jgi:hypothetical protein